MMNGPTRSRNSGVGRPDHRGDKPDRAMDGRRGGDEPRRNGAHDDGGQQPRRRTSGAAIVDSAKAHLTELTGRPCEGVSSLNRTPDGWRVVVEVVELERVPRTTDILASYLVELDGDGELMGYERLNRYYRNDVSGEQ
jgi:hypothetical protein